MYSTFTKGIAATAIVFLLLSGCQPVAKLQNLSNTLIPLTPSTPVEILYITELPPTEAQYLGKLKIKDSGFSFNCSLPEVIELAKEEARAAGGNILLITKHRKPDGFSTCHRIEAEIYKLEKLTNVKMQASAGQDTTNKYTYTEVLPQFPGGDYELLKFINKNTQYPATAIKDRVQGIVVVSFVVSKTGKISDIEIKNSVRWDLDQEAIRLITIMPDWTPGYQNDKPVPVRYTVPLSFSIKPGLFQGKNKRKASN